MLDTNARKYANGSINHLANIFLKFNLTPNTITIVAFFIGLLASVSIFLNLNILAVILLWISGLLDATDGAMARISGNTSKVGTLMDIVFDRIVEISVIFALTLVHPSNTLSALLLAFSIILSMTVFLTVGALAPNTGVKSFKYQAGLIERTEAFVFFTLMILFKSFFMPITLLLAFLILFTAFQRFLEGIKLL